MFAFTLQKEEKTLRRRKVKQFSQCYLDPRKKWNPSLFDLTSVFYCLPDSGLSPLGQNPECVAHAQGEKLVLSLGRVWLHDLSVVI